MSLDLLQSFGRGAIVAWAAALAEAAIVEGESVDAGVGELLRDGLPRFARRVAHVEEKHSGAGLGGRVEGGAQLGAVGRGNVEVFGSRSLSNGSDGQEEDREETHGMLLG